MATNTIPASCIGAVVLYVLRMFLCKLLGHSIDLRTWIPPLVMLEGIQVCKNLSGHNALFDLTVASIMCCTFHSSRICNASFLRVLSVVESLHILYNVHPF